MNKIARFITDRDYRFIVCAMRGLYNSIPDDMYLQRMYSARVGRTLDLDHPVTFNEKLQWLKLHDRNPLYTTLVDKYAVKQWVAERLGEQYVVPTYGVWSRFDDIDFNRLPERFVLKCTHDSGGLVICHDRKSFDIQAARKKITKSLRANYFWRNREWPYKDVPPRIIAEKYLDSADGSSNLADYKLYRFTDGRILALICEDRHLGKRMYETYYDESWNLVDLTEGGHPSKPACSAPPHFEEMKDAARLLGEGMPFVRVDFYEGQQGPLFGELTFFTAGGYEMFDPPEWDAKLGEWIDLSAAYGPH